MEELILSPDFTIEDIHKLREYNYNKTKDMSPEERRNYYKEKSMACQRKIDAIRLQDV